MINYYTVDLWRWFYSAYTKLKRSHKHAHCPPFTHTRAHVYEQKAFTRRRTCSQACTQIRARASIWSVEQHSELYTIFMPWSVPSKPRFPEVTIMFRHDLRIVARICNPSLAFGLHGCGVKRMYKWSSCWTMIVADYAEHCSIDWIQ